MRKVLLTLCLSIVAIAGFSTTIDKRPLPTHYTPEKKVYALSLLWSELKYNFVHSDQLTFQPDSLYRSYIPQVLQTQNDVEFFDLLKQFIARFNDGHTAIVSYSYNWNEVNDFAPMLLEELNGRFYVSQVWESSGLDSLAVGAELLRIEDTPAREYVEKHYLPYIAHRSQRAKLAIAASEYMGTGAHGSSFRCELKFRDGHRETRSISNNSNALNAENKSGRAWAWQGFRKPRRAPVTLEWLPNDIALLDFRFFNMKTIPEMDSLLNIVSDKAKGLIIDLRYCPGGASPVGDRLLTRILHTDYFLTDLSQTRINNGYGRSQGNYRPEYEDFFLDRAYETLPADTIRTDPSSRIQCPIAILIGTSTASAAETFLVRLYEIPERPVLIGQQTEGSSGAPLVIDLPHGAVARLCTRRLLFPHSKKPFVEGIVPDISVPLSVEDYITGDDRVLDEAIEQLRQQ